MENITVKRLKTRTVIQLNNANLDTVIAAAKCINEDITLMDKLVVIRPKRSLLKELNKPVPQDEKEFKAYGFTCKPTYQAFDNPDYNKKKGDFNGYYITTDLNIENIAPQGFGKDATYKDILIRSIRYFDLMETKEIDLIYKALKQQEQAIKA